MKSVVANMTGSVWKLVVDIGDHVTSGQEVAILESMKMEIPITAEVDGIVKELKVKEGDFINEGDVIAILE